MHDGWIHGQIQRSRHGVRTPSPPPGKSHVVIGFLRKSGTDHPPEAIGPFGQLLLEGGLYIDD